MSTIDLIILGSLYQSPKKCIQSYKKQIEDRHLARWVKIGSYTVYKKLSIYEKKDLSLVKQRRMGICPKKQYIHSHQMGKQSFVN